MNKVKFHFADNGFVELATGKSSFSDLFVLGALQLTSKINCRESCYEYPTDKQGLEKLIRKSNELLTHLHDGIGVLGMLMTDSKSEEPKENLHGLAWLLVGLNELSSSVAHNNAEMNHTLRTKKPD